MKLKWPFKKRLTSLERFALGLKTTQEAKMKIGRPPVYKPIKLNNK